MKSHTQTCEINSHDEDEEFVEITLDNNDLNSKSLATIDETKATDFKAENKSSALYCDNSLLNQTSEKISRDECPAKIRIPSANLPMSFFEENPLTKLFVRKGIFAKFTEYVTKKNSEINDPSHEIELRFKKLESNAGVIQHSLSQGEDSQQAVIDAMADALSSDLSNISSHDEVVCDDTVVFDEGDLDDAVYYYKPNATTTEDEVKIAILEAMCGDFYALISPEIAPLTRAHYIIDEKGQVKYTGLSSKGIPNFKTITQDPLKIEDLCIPVLGIEIDKNDPEKIIYDENKQQISIAEFDLLYKKYKNRLTQNPKSIITEYVNNKKINFTIGELINYEICAGSAKGITTSHFFAEDDKNKNNINKKGQRIDLGMSLWPVLAKFKQVFLRTPANRFPVTKEDTESLPIPQVFCPAYWCAQPADNSQSAKMKSTLTTLFTSGNKFTSAVSKTYSLFATHPVFVYHKYKCYLKGLLTIDEMYENIAKMHLPADMCYTDTNTKKTETLISMVMTYWSERLKQFQRELCNSVPFYEFLKKDGDQAFNDIINEFNLQNQKHETKIKSLEQEYENLAQKCVRLLMIDKQPNDINLELALKSESAYVRVHNDNEDKLFYINKTTNCCVKINLNPEQFIEFDKTLKPQEEKILSKEQIETIMEITSFVPAKNNSREYYISDLHEKNEEINDYKDLIIDTDAMVERFEKIVQKTTALNQYRPRSASVYEPRPSRDGLFKSLYNSMPSLPSYTSISFNPFRRTAD